MKQVRQSITVIIKLHNDFASMTGYPLFDEIQTIITSYKLDVRSEINIAVLLFATGKVIKSLNASQTGPRLHVPTPYIRGRLYESVTMSRSISTSALNRSRYISGFDISLIVYIQILDKLELKDTFWNGLLLFMTNVMLPKYKDILCGKSFESCEERVKAKEQFFTSLEQLFKAVSEHPEEVYIINQFSTSTVLYSRNGTIGISLCF